MLQGSGVVWDLVGVACVECVQRSRQASTLRRERACPFRRTQKRSVTWRSDLFIDLTFTHINPPIPGPGPQARCGKGVWSPEDQGDRCRVPRSFGPSGAGGEQRASLKRTQHDDQPKGLRRCGGYTSSDRLTAATFPSRGRQWECGYTSSGPSGHLPLQGEGSRGAHTPHPIRRPQVLPL